MAILTFFTRKPSHITNYTAINVVLLTECVGFFFNLKSIFEGQINKLSEQRDWEGEESHLL